MKTIAQVVEGMNKAELVRIARNEISRRANEYVREIIVNQNRAVRQAGEKAGDSWKSLYLSARKGLVELDLWDARYDGHYARANRGELNIEELVKVRIE